jgi:hypothetical protein
MTSLGVLLLLAAAGPATPAPDGDPAAEERPIEYVRRPQADPAGWVRATPTGRLGS